MSTPLHDRRCSPLTKDERYDKIRIEIKFRIKNDEKEQN